MKFQYLTFFATQINSAIDSGKYPRISLAEVNRQVQAGEIFPFLREQFGYDIDLGNDTELEEELTRNLQAWSRYGDAWRWGIQKNGLCMLVAWTLQMMLDKQWKEWN